MKGIRIGLLGCGTVGTGVAKILIENKKIIESRVGVPIILKYVADLDTEKDRGIRFDDGVMVPDAFKVIEDPNLDIVAEMIGGKTIAKTIILKAIENQKHVVTANKALLASFGNEIFRASAERGVELGFEASVGGCMPVIKTIRESMVGNNITRVAGILNGTCNYILSMISDRGINFGEALSQAKENGFAEADPTLDIEGHDTAHKLAIICCLAYGMEINLNDIYIEGISGITPMDIKMAGEFGYRVKLLAISKCLDSGIEARVHPAMIPFSNLLSNVNGSLNAVSLKGDATGEIILHGHGAGMMPTASAVVSDIVDIARNLICGVKTRVPALSFQMGNIQKIPVLPISQLRTRYYLRLSADDSPGVLSKVSGILGNFGISIKTVHQKGRNAQGSVPIVMLTHMAREEDMQKALAEIRALEVINDKPVLIRIEADDENRQDLF